MGQINNYGLVWPTQTIITHWVVFHGKREIWTVSWSHSVSSLSLATALLPFSYAVGLFWASPQFCQWASWTPGRMLKMPKILIFLAILALGASHPLISGGVIRSHKSMPKWRPFQTAGEDPRILPLAAAIMKENSAAPHPPILHGNGPVSISKILKNQWNVRFLPRILRLLRRIWRTWINSCLESRAHSETKSLPCWL